MILVSLLFFIYLITIAIFAHGFDKVKEFKTTPTEVITGFSIIIPFRNEARNLPHLLESIIAIDYPTTLIEFIFVDDDSSDDSITILDAFTKLNSQIDISVIKNIRNSNSPKKDAISTALNNAKNNWIITSDADCILPKNWLQTFDYYIQQNDCNLLVAPVTYSVNRSFLHQFQLLDFLSLQASTIGGFGLQKPFLCNGANLAYKKEIFEAVNGFENNNSIASGEDVFLLEKFIKFDKQKVHYLKSSDAIVTTSPVDSFKALIHQRVRWASKTANYSLFFGKLIGLIVLIGNGIMLAAPFLYFYELLSFTSLVSYFLMKLFFDFLLIERISSFYKQKISFLSYLISSIIYPYFTVFVFLWSLFSPYQWKDRTFKK